MKVLNYISDNNEMKQGVVVVMTTHVIDTKNNNKANIKELPIAVIKNWKLLYEKEYVIQYPGNWRLEQSGKMGLTFILYSQSSSNPDRFDKNVNLLVQDLKGKKMRLDKYVEISEKQVKTEIAYGTILESKRIYNGDNNYHKLLYTGNTGIFKFKFLQYYWIKNEKAYVLTLTCDINEFDCYKETAEKVMNSFALQ